MRVSVDQRLVEAIEKYKPEQAILFGSRAAGNADQFSDYDVLLVKRTNKPFVERLKEFALILPNDLPRVDAFIYTPEEFQAMQERDNPLVKRAIEEGQVIYEASA